MGNILRMFVSKRLEIKYTKLRPNSKRLVDESKSRLKFILSSRFASTEEKERIKEIHKLIFLTAQICEIVNFNPPRYEDYFDDIPPSYENIGIQRMRSEQEKTKIQINFIKDSCCFLSDFLQFL